MRLLVLLFFLGMASAQFEGGPEEAKGTPLEDLSEAEIVRQMMTRLASEPGMAESLAARINRSSLAGAITSTPDEAARLREIRAWIAENLEEAAGLAVGLGRDDAESSRRFEEFVSRRVRTHLEYNPESKRGIFGRLWKTSDDSRLMRKEEGMTEEEQREIMRTLFEGRGTMTNRIITQQEQAGAKQVPEAGPSQALSTRYYDRLSQANLRGYSPQVQAMQSALNARRVPGGPRLIETGRLDYETLSYPSHAMRFDIANLERRLRYERNYALARLLGREREFGPEQLLNSEVEAQLKAQAGGKGRHKGFEKRQAAIEKATLAARKFEEAALPGKDPSRITRELLLSLGSRQREASRWITVAALAEELNGIEAQEGFLSPELLAVIARAPVEEAAKAAYRRRGEELDKNLLQLKSNDEAAVRALESEAWISSVEAIEKLLSRNAGLRKNLSRDIRDYARAAFLLASSAEPKARWRKLVEYLVKRFLPWSAYAKRLKAEEARQGLLKDVFLKIATGDLEAAHAVLVYL